MNMNDMTPWNWFGRDTKKKAVKKAQSSHGWHPLSNLQQKVDSLFNEFFDDFDTHFPERDTRANNASLLYPKVDISETSTGYKISIELPGVERKDVQIAISNRCLVVKGVKKHAVEEKDENFHKIERIYGSFERIISLPDNVNEDNVIAELRDGVLHVELAKKDMPKSAVKQIEIK